MSSASKDLGADMISRIYALQISAAICLFGTLADAQAVLNFAGNAQHTAVYQPPAKDLNLDLNIPKKPGREVLEWLRRSVRGRCVPVVILSSSDAQQDRADVAHLGADRYIRKPSDLEEFLSLGAVFKEMLCSSPR
jgi:DNA-binding response OmpR family regulator